MGIEDSQINRGNKGKPWVLLAFWVAVICVTIWLSIGIATWKSFSDATRSGQFGDTFGFVNALFSALGLAGVLITILMQQDQLQLQRKELELQREEMKLQRAELKHQREEMARSVQAQLLSAFVSANDSLRQSNDWLERTLALVIDDISTVGDILHSQCVIRQNLNAALKSLNRELINIDSSWHDSLGGETQNERFQWMNLIHDVQSLARNVRFMSVGDGEYLSRLPSVQEKCRQLREATCVLLKSFETREWYVPEIVKISDFPVPADMPQGEGEDHFERCRYHKKVLAESLEEYGRKLLAGVQRWLF